MMNVEALNRWFTSGDTSTSSEVIVAHMTNCLSDVGLSSGNLVQTCKFVMSTQLQGGWALAPRESTELGRCMRLLDLFPEWKPRIQEMAVYGADWAGICAQWDFLVDSLVAEVGDVQWKSKFAGILALKTSHRMRLAAADGYRRDPS